MVIKTKENQIRALMRLLESGVLNEAQSEIISRLITTTSLGTENFLAKYFRTPEFATEFWSKNLEAVSL